MKTRNLEALRTDKETQPFMSRNGGAKSSLTHKRPKIHE